MSKIKRRYMLQILGEALSSVVLLLLSRQGQKANDKRDGRGTVHILGQDTVTDPEEGFLDF